MYFSYPISYWILYSITWAFLQKWTQKPYQTIKYLGNIPNTLTDLLQDTCFALFNNLFIQDISFNIFVHRQISTHTLQSSVFISFVWPFFMFGILPYISAVSAKHWVMYLFLALGCDIFNFRDSVLFILVHSPLYIIIIIRVENNNVLTWVKNISLNLQQIIKCV